MDFEKICYLIIAGTIMGMILTFVMLKSRKLLNEKAFIYGIISASIMTFSTSFISGAQDFGNLLIDGLFLALVFYNMTNVFGIRMGLIHEDHKGFLSYFCGLSVIGNLFSLLLFGIGGVVLVKNFNSPEFIELISLEYAQLLLDSYKVTLFEYGYLLALSLLVAFVIGYMSISMYIHSFKNKVIRTNVKASLLLLVYNVINLTSPADSSAGVTLMILYLSLLVAGYLIYKQSKEDKPSISVVIK